MHVQVYAFFQVSDNGIISFNRTFNLSTPLPLPLSGTDKIIAPYWADVDIRGTGNIYYRQTTDPSLLARATSEIRAASSVSQNFMAKHLLIVTWNAVGYYNRNTDKVQTICVAIYICNSYTMTTKGTGIQYISVLCKSLV